MMIEIGKFGIYWGRSTVPNPEKSEITNYKHKITTKLKITISKSQTTSKANCLVRRKRIRHCDLPFDLAQGHELVEPFAICFLAIEI